ncbi:hypothetical protein FHU35_111316 [Saccharopolyspora dendranthemae]|uniref:Uncharacterized protein n=1 Tax=Saccharopolyspora dendranthemae TaxID=1181886 RepID=A0A561VAP5_9PSEU|nr:hypothetical protein FHU35_111316 [Saccharopolyspora dendranthemae]
MNETRCYATPQEQQALTRGVRISLSRRKTPQAAVSTSSGCSSVTTT